MSTIPKRVDWVPSAMGAIRAISCKRCWPWSQPARRFWGSRLRKHFCVYQPLREKRVESATNASRKSRRSGNGRRSALERPQRDVSTFMWETEAVISLRFSGSVSRRECGFLVRVQHDRRVDLRVDQAETPLPPGARRYGTQRPAGQDPVRRLFEEVKEWPPRGQQSIRLDGNHKCKEREAKLCISWGTLRLWPPDGEAGKGERPLVVTVVRT